MKRSQAPAEALVGNFTQDCLRFVFAELQCGSQRVDRRGLRVRQVIVDEGYASRREPAGR